VRNHLEGRINYQNDIIQTSFDGISANLTSSSNYLTFIGLTVAVFAIILGVYITVLERKIVRINREGKNLVDSHRKEIDDFTKLIENNLAGLYNRIREEDTKNILDRLAIIPKDIANLSKSLLSRELPTEYFQKIKQCYLEIREYELAGEYDYKTQYILLLFQHYLGLSVCDEDISADIENNYKDCMNAAFENDIIKSTDDFFKAIIDRCIWNFNDKINNYIKSICISKYKDFKPVYSAIFNRLTTKENQIKLIEIIEDDGSIDSFKKIYNQLVLEKYSTEELSNSEQLTLNTIITD